MGRLHSDRPNRQKRHPRTPLTTPDPEGTRPCNPPTTPPPDHPRIPSTHQHAPQPDRHAPQPDRHAPQPDRPHPHRNAQPPRNHLPNNAPNRTHHPTTGTPHHSQHTIHIPRRLPQQPHHTLHQALHHDRKTPHTLHLLNLQHPIHPLATRPTRRQRHLLRLRITPHRRSRNQHPTLRPQNPIHTHPTHTPTPNEGTMPDWNKGSTRQWRQLRLQILDRDNHQCQLKIPDICTHRATHVHHINGRKQGDNPDNLQAACAECNWHIGDPTMPKRQPHTTTDPQPNIWTPPTLRTTT